MGWLLLIYLAGLLVVGGLGVACLYHVKRYRCAGDLAGAAAGLYILSVVIILVISVGFIASIDWSQSL